MASAQISVKLEGAGLLIETLRTFGPRVEKKHVKRSINRAIKPMKTAAQRNARKYRKTGFFSRNIDSKDIRFANGNHVVILGGVNVKDPNTGQNPAHIAHLIEGGTKPHPIPKGGPGKNILTNIGGVPEWAGDTIEFYGRQVTHPGTDPRPFLEPAYSANLNTSQEIFRKSLSDGIDQEALRAEIRSRR